MEVNHEEDGDAEESEEVAVGMDVVGQVAVVVVDEGAIEVDLCSMDAILRVPSIQNEVQSKNHIQSNDITNRIQST